MKRIEFIAPVESMRGNLSGNQSLEYAENNNPAYQAPNGVQYARNYQPRFIGAKRGSDGLKYFAVRTKSATNLKASTRRAMAVVGVTAAIRSALMSAHAADYAKMQHAFDYLKTKGQLPEGQDTFKKWFDANVKSMLVYKKATWTFTQASISFTLTNPYNIASSNALVIKTSIWVKYANIFAFAPDTTISSAFVTFDGVLMFGAVPDGTALDTTSIKSQANPNMVQSLARVTVVGGSDTYVAFDEQPVYTPTNAKMRPTTVWVEGSKYTTAVPIE